MVVVSIAVEGASDVAAVEKLLASRSILVAASRIFVTRGKGKFDQKLVSYNKAASYSPWLVVRDSDHDAGDCPAQLRASLLPLALQSPSLSFRIAVRSLESWLLADAEAFAAAFSVAQSAIPGNVDLLPDAKLALVNACRKSRKSSVRKAMVPPVGSAAKVGPEYVTWILEYSRNLWRPDIAAQSSPSLGRALQEIDALLSSQRWS